MGTMNLELSNEQTAVLEKELRDIVENDRYPLSPRILTLKEILNKILFRNASRVLKIAV